jgi:predicted nuclease with TOPRIM domain
MRDKDKIKKLETDNAALIEQLKVQSDVIKYLEIRLQQVHAERSLLQIMRDAAQEAIDRDVETLERWWKL